ncbi:MAG: hypothetical protein WC807_12720 [Hyphomicrobium sp.]|jgi:hypothetical protein
MKTFIVALFATTLAFAANAEADVTRDLAQTGSIITLHGVFDGR